MQKKFQAIFRRLKSQKWTNTEEDYVKREGDDDHEQGGSPQKK